MADQPLRSSTRSAGDAGTHPSGPAGRRPARRRTRPSTAPPPGSSLATLAAHVAQVYLEVECGRRPGAQLRGVLAPRLAAQLEGRWVRPGPPGVLLAVTGSRCAEDAYEAVAVVRRGPRVGAIAIRFARRHGRWLVVEAGRPEDGPLPEPAFPVVDDEPDAFDLLALDEGEAPMRRPSIGELPALSLG
jgi:hypothetical protein